MMIGYARVSTDEQNLALQRDALRSAGCETIFEDTASGADDGRKGLADAVARCAAGDVLVAWKIDRLGRSTLDLVGLVEKLKGRGVGLKVLTGEGASIDTTRPEGKLIFAVFAAFAEFERELIRERTMAGMRAAKHRGRHVGRPRKLTPHKIDHARELIAGGKETKAGAAALLGVNAVTLRRALRALAIGAGFLVMSIATQAEAMSVHEFFNDKAVSDTAGGAALVLSLKTEAFRNAQAGRVAKADCIEENLLVGEHNQNRALLEHMRGAKNKSADVEGYVLRAIELYCPAGGGAQGSPAHEKFGATPVQDFYKIVPDNVDKATVLSLAISTQRERVRLAGDPERAQCIEGLQATVVDRRPVSVPDAFRQDVMKKLAVASASASTPDSVESILMDAITKNCGHERG